MSADPRARFSDRVADYARTRPGYPPEVLELLRAECGLGPASVVADIGAGTGIFTRLLLATGAEVYALEPNAAMRAELSRALGGSARLHVLEAAAEHTTLAAASMTLIGAAQAFHWFGPQETRAEFRRVLRPGGWVALIWNTREEQASAFAGAYESMLRLFGTDYAQVDHRRVVREGLDGFFAPGELRAARFAYQQSFDLEGVRSRLMSSSFVPAPGQPQHEPLMRALEAAFVRHAREGRVQLDYTTEVYFGRLA